MNKREMRLATKLKYNKSEKGKAANKRYKQTEKGRFSNERYLLGKMGKKARKIHDQRARIRHPERIKARNAVNNAVYDNRLPPPNDFRCSCCPFDAEEYHHHRGYAPEHRLDVVPVCRVCHRKIHSTTSL